MKAIKRELHYVAPGLKSQVISLAENDQIIPSRHTNTIDKETKELDQNINELDEGTKARNRAFQQRLDEIWAMTSGWEAKLKTEAIESSESIINLKNEYQNHIEKFQNDFLNDINVIFNKYDNELIPKEAGRLDVLDSQVDSFYQITAPKALEQQAGLLNKELKKTYENFHIEQYKEKKRNIKFVNHVNKHIQKTSQRFNDESALIDSCIFTLYNNIMDSERPLINIYQYKRNLCTNHIIALKDTFSILIDRRKSEDLDVLDTVIETQKLLQHIVIANFGSETEDYIHADDITFPKLANRLNIIKNRVDSPVVSQVDDQIDSKIINQVIEDKNITNSNDDNKKIKNESKTVKKKIK